MSPALLDSQKLQNTFFNQINNLKERYENSYPLCHDRELHSMAPRLFRRLLSWVEEALDGDFSTGARIFRQSQDLVDAFAEKYQELSSIEFSQHLSKIAESLNFCWLLAEILSSLNNADNTDNVFIHYQGSAQGYQLLGDLTDKHWYKMTTDLRDSIVKLATSVREKADSISPDDFATKEDFHKYKQSVAYLTSSVARRNEKDKLLSLLGEYSQKSMAEENSRKFRELMDSWEKEYDLEEMEETTEFLMSVLKREE